MKYSQESHSVNMKGIVASGGIVKFISVLFYSLRGCDSNIRLVDAGLGWVFIGNICTQILENQTKN